MDSSDEDTDFVNNDSSNNANEIMPVDSNVDFTPVESLNVGGHEQSIRPDVGSDNVEADHSIVEQVDLQDCPSEENVIDVVSDVPSSCRPKRVTKKPSYLNDYEC